MRTRRGSRRSTGWSRRWEYMTCATAARGEVPRARSTMGPASVTWYRQDAGSGARPGRTTATPRSTSARPPGRPAPRGIPLLRASRRAMVDKHAIGVRHRVRLVIGLTAARLMPRDHHARPRARTPPTAPTPRPGEPAPGWPRSRMRHDQAGRSCGPRRPGAARRDQGQITRPPRPLRTEGRRHGARIGRRRRSAA